MAKKSSASTAETATEETTVVEETTTVSEESVAEETTTVEETATVVEETTAATATVATTTTTVDLLAVPSTLGALGRAVADAFISYETNMKPGKPVKEVDGIRFQKSFSTAVFQLVNDVSDDDFEELYPWVLYRFSTYSKGVYGADYIFRFMQNVALSKENRDSFMRLINLLRTTAAADTRSLAVKQINFSALFDTTITQRGQTRLQSFYNL